MGDRLNGNTVVRHPDTQIVVTLHAGETLPEWAVGQVGDHLLDSPAADASSEPEPPLAPPAGHGDPDVPDPTPSTDPNPGPDVPSAPPRAGRGSGVDVWKAHAESLGLTVPDGASRDAIVELVDEHNDK